MLKSAPIRIILGLLSAVAVFGLFYPFFIYLLLGLSGGNFYCHWNQSKQVEFNRENRDDIFEGGPAKLKVCFVEGKQCSFSYETDEGREVLAFCPENDKCYITEIDSFRVKLHGLATPFLENPGFYFFAMAFFAIAMGLCILGIKNGIKKLYYRASLFFFVGLGSLIWWVVCYAESKILFLHFFILTGIVAAVGFVFYRLFRKRVLTNDKPV